MGLLSKVFRRSKHSGTQADTFSSEIVVTTAKCPVCDTEVGLILGVLVNTYYCRSASCYWSQGEVIDLLSLDPEASND